MAENDDILSEVRFVEIGCGFGHNLAVVAGSGQIYSWGANLCGQLGVGDQNDRYLPTLIADLVSLSSCNLNPVFHSDSKSSLHSKDDNVELHKMDQNEHRQHIVFPPADPFDAPPPPPIRAAIHYENGVDTKRANGNDVVEHKESECSDNDDDNVSDKVDGFVAAERELYRRNAVSGDDGQSAESAESAKQSVLGLQQNENPVIKVACGAFHSAALTIGGDVFCWGDNSDGQLGIGNISGAAGTLRTHCGTEWSDLM